METTTLQIIWFGLWVLLWAMYFTLDGFDLGMGTLLPFIAKNEQEKRTIYNAAGPFWDGNEVWLITAGGVTFAAFPLAYAVMFSSLYAPLLILLFALIFRAVSFEFRNKINSDTWRRNWDICQFLGSFLPALLLGVAFANLFQGIPVNADLVYEGNILKLLNPYGLSGGVLFVIMFSYHGALWLAFKSNGELHERAVRWAKTLWVYLLAAIVAFAAATLAFGKLYKDVPVHPVLAIMLIIALCMLVISRAAGPGGLLAWLGSALFILLGSMFAIAGLFPNIIISSLNKDWSITIAGAASSEATLIIMLAVVLCCVPVVLGYQLWVYITFSHKITPEELASDHAY